MERSKKYISFLVICICLVLQFAAFVGAQESGRFNVTLPNFQEKVLLFTGLKTDDTKHAYVTVDGGTVNYVYVQMTSRKTGREFTNWTKIPHDGVRYSLPYKLQPIKDKATVLVTGYQKNVFSKTALGRVVL